MKIPYIVEEFKNNEWQKISSPLNEVYANAQYETMTQTGRVI